MRAGAAVVVAAFVLTAGVLAAPRLLAPRVSAQQAAGIALQQVSGGNYTAASSWTVVATDLELTGSRVLEADGSLGGPTLQQWDRVRRVWLVELQAPPQRGLTLNRAAVLIDADSGAVFEVVTISDNLDGSLRS